MSTDGPAAWGSLLATVLVNAGLALAVGAIASLFWARRFRSLWASRVRSRSMACLGGGIGLAVAAGIADLWSRSADAAGVAWADAWTAVRSMLAASHYGRAWIAGMLALLLLAAIVRFAATGRRSRAVAASAAPPATLIAACLCIAVFVYTRSVVSHAAEGGDLSLAVAVDWLHLVLIALWVGVVFVASVVPFEPLPRAADDRHDIAGWIGALSRAATVAVVGIVVTGLFNTWRGTGGALASLPGSTYGTVLVAKLLVVFVATGLGAHNRFRVLPSLLADLCRTDGTSPHLRRFVTVIRMEALTLAAALALAAVLSATEANTAP